MNRKYIRNTAILFASMTITKIVGAIFKIPLANVLGGTGMGYFSTAYGLYSPVFALTAAGIPTVMMRITAQNIAAGRPGNASGRAGLRSCCFPQWDSSVHSPWRCSPLSSRSTSPAPRRALRRSLPLPRRSCCAVSPP